MMPEIFTIGADNMAVTEVLFAYTDYLGKLSVRRAIPKRFWHGSTQYHPNEQWIMTAYDMDTEKDRDFALSGCHFMTTSWRVDDD